MDFKSNLSIVCFCVGVTLPLPNYATDVLEDLYFTQMEGVVTFRKYDPDMYLIDIYSARTYFSNGYSKILSREADNVYEDARKAYEAGELSTRIVLSKTNLGSKITDYRLDAKRAEYEINSRGQIQNYLNFETGDFCGHVTGLDIKISTCYDAKGDIVNIEKKYFDKEGALIERVLYDSAGNKEKKFKYYYKGSMVDIFEFDSDEELISEYSRRWDAIQ